MEADKNLMMELLATKDNLFTIKKLDVYRSNFIAVLEKRTFGIRSFEVSNKGNFRISGYKMTEEQVKHFEDLGMVAKHSKTAMYTWTFHALRKTLKTSSTLLTLCNKEIKDEHEKPECSNRPRQKVNEPSSDFE